MMNIPGLARNGIAFLQQMLDSLKKYTTAWLRRDTSDTEQPSITFGRIVAVLLVLLVGFYTFRRVTESVIIIEPFTLPEKISTQGYTQTGLANLLHDKIRVIAERGTIFTPYPYLGKIPPRQKLRPGAATTRANSLGYQLAPDALAGNAIETMVVPTTGLSLASLIETLQYLLNRSPMRITSEIIPAQDAAVGEAAAERYLLHVRLTRGAHTEASVYSSLFTLEELDGTLMSAAEEIYQARDPLTLALYMLNTSRTSAEIRGLADAASSRDPENTYWALFLLGVLSARDGDHKTAIWWFDHSIQTNQQRPMLLWRRSAYDDVLLSVTYIHKIQSLMSSDLSGRCDEAKTTLDTYGRRTYFPISLKLVTEAWVKVSCDQAAVDELIEEAIRADPVHASKYYSSLAGMLYATNSLDKALVAAQNAVARDSDDAVAHNTVGIIYFDQQKFVSAKFHFETAIKLSTSQELIYWISISNLSWTYNSLKQAALRDELLCQIVSGDATGQRPPEEFVMTSYVVLALAPNPCE